MQRDLLESGAQLQRGQSLITEENLVKMMEDLIRHCDAIDRFGLVDYQYGVWEERISTSKFSLVLLSGLRNRVLIY